MKKVFFATILVVVAIFGISATAANASYKTSDNYTSSVTATIAGMDREFVFDTETLVAIYNLMPQDVKELCRESYYDIATRIERSNKGLTYAGVKITPTETTDGTTLTFSRGKYQVVVNNYTKSEFDAIFEL